MYVKIDKIYIDGDIVENKMRFATNLQIWSPLSLPAKFKLEDVRDNTTYLLDSMFSIDGIEEIEMEEKAIVVTKKEDFEWGIIKPQILSTLMDAVVDKKTEATSPSSQVNDFVPTTELEKGIERVLNERIMPAIHADGGGLDFLGIENGVVKVRLKGACVGCNSAPITLKAGIERAIKHFFPEIERVENVEE